MNFGLCWNKGFLSFWESYEYCFGASGTFNYCEITFLMWKQFFKTSETISDSAECNIDSSGKVVL